MSTDDQPAPLAVELDGRDDRAILDEALHFVAQRSWRATESEFFDDLVKFLGSTLNVAYAFCDAIDPADHSMVETLALYAHGKTSDNIRYSLKDTPCDNVVGHSFCCHESSVQELFPNDALLTELNAESYAGIPLWASNGDPIGLVGIMDDKPLRDPDLVKRVLQIVAARAGAEMERQGVLKQFQTSQLRFADFADISSDWFWETDSQLRFSYFSEQFESVSGVPPGELLGKTRAEVGAPGADVENFQGLLQHLDEHTAFRDFVHTRSRSSGETVYLSISGKPAFDEAGNFTGFRGIGRDVTEQKRVEREPIKSRDIARDASNAKTGFLANMSHELRTPLNAIIGFSQMLKGETFGSVGSDANKEYIDIIHSAGNHLHKLIGDILDLSKIEAGEEELNEENLSVDLIIEECMTMMSDRAMSKNQAFTSNVQFDIPQLTADRLKFKQIILNLLSNAIKFTPENGKVTVHAVHDNKRSILLKIEDTGVGMSVEGMAAVLDPFSRTTDAYTKAQEGTGLGLPLVKSLAELHGGSVEMESEPGVRTIVTVRFPPERTADGS